MVAVVITLSGILSSCATHQTGPATQPKPAATASRAIALPPDGLCAFIDAHTASQALVGTPGAITLSSPLPPEAGEVARCILVNPSPPAYVSYEISIAPVMQSGKDTFANLQSNSALVQDNVNGNQMIWDPHKQTLYLRFDDTNEALSGNAKGTESILTILGQAENTSTPSQTLVTFAEHAVDEIQLGRVAVKSGCDQCGPQWGSGPMLIDDQDQPVPNPAIVLQVYYALAMDDTFQLSRGFATDGSTPDYWATTEMPYLNQPSVVSQIARSMTVHPHCQHGCAYPGFLFTGWNSATARADGIKLGIDPAKVPNPTYGHGTPVYDSEFPTTMTDWDGTHPPGS